MFSAAAVCGLQVRCWGAGRWMRPESPLLLGPPSSPGAPLWRCLCLPSCPCLPVLFLLPRTPSPRVVRAVTTGREVAPPSHPLPQIAQRVLDAGTLPCTATLPGTQHRSWHRAGGKRNLLNEQGGQSTFWLARPPDNASWMPTLNTQDWGHSLIQLALLREKAWIHTSRAVML